MILLGSFQSIFLINVFIYIATCTTLRLPNSVLNPNVQSDDGSSRSSDGHYSPSTPSTASSPSPFLARIASAWQQVQTMYQDQGFQILEVEYRRTPPFRTLDIYEIDKHVALKITFLNGFHGPPDERRVIVMKTRDDRRDQWRPLNPYAAPHALSPSQSLLAYRHQTFTPADISNVDLGTALSLFQSSGRVPESFKTDFWQIGSITFPNSQWPMRSQVTYAFDVRFKGIAYVGVLPTQPRVSYTLIRAPASPPPVYGPFDWDS